MSVLLHTDFSWGGAAAGGECGGPLVCFLPFAEVSIFNQSLATALAYHKVLEASQGADAHL